MDLTAIFAWKILPIKVFNINKSGELKIGLCEPKPS